jgi:hypothetical protein
MNKIFHEPILGECPTLKYACLRIKHESMAVLGNKVAQTVPRETPIFGRLTVNSYRYRVRPTISYIKYVSATL